MKKSSSTISIPSHRYGGGFKTPGQSHNNSNVNSAQTSPSRAMNHSASYGRFATPGGISALELQKVTPILKHKSPYSSPQSARAHRSLRSSGQNWMCNTISHFSSSKSLQKASQNLSRSTSNLGGITQELEEAERDKKSLQKIVTELREKVKKARNDHDSHNLYNEKLYNDKKELHRNEGLRESRKTSQYRQMEKILTDSEMVMEEIENYKEKNVELADIIKDEKILTKKLDDFTQRMKMEIVAVNKNKEKMRQELLVSQRQAEHMKIRCEEMEYKMKMFYARAKGSMK